LTEELKRRNATKRKNKFFMSCLLLEVEKVNFKTSASGEYVGESSSQIKQ
jgi:hypothetical protein